MKKNLKLLMLIGISICLVNCKKPAGTDDGDPAVNGDNTRTSALPNNPNVLLIVVDDLRYWSINRLWEDDVDRKAGNIQPYTPNLDAFIDESVTFTRSYAPGIACTPSRTAFLSGLRPETTGIYRVGNDWQTVAALAPNQMIVKRFLNAGYLVNGAGKIFHGNSDGYWGGTDYHESSAALDPAQTPPIAALAGNKQGYVFDVIQDADEDKTEDHLTVDFCINKMGVAKNNNPDNKPFFIACGIRRPHNPLIAPQKYLAHYPLSSMITPPVVPADMSGLPKVARDLAKAQGCGTIMDPDTLQQTDQTYWKKYLQSYMANVSFVDYEVGRLLTALENKGFADNTIVVFISDHGVHLGEKHHIHKNTLWEETTRAPMIWRVPGNVGNGSKCRVPVSLMDIYRTLKDYCNLGSAPKAIEADNIRTLIENPATDPSGHFAVTAMNLKSSTVQGQTWQLIQYNQDTSKEELYHRNLDPWAGDNRKTNPGNAPLISLRNKLPSSFAAQVGVPNCD